MGQDQRINIDSRNMNINNQSQIIIGIDFGTSGLCYAYGALNNDRRKEIALGHFEGQGRNNKISNEIILDDELETVLAFGNLCDSFLSSTHDFNFHHFKNVKMNLYKRIYKVKATNSDKEADIEYIIYLILAEAKIKAEEQIKLSEPNINVENIHYVITVPAIWDIKSKQIMIQASKKAGLIREDDDLSNFFALEPECASIYFGHENIGKQAYEMIIKDFREQSFILCDYGSGTVDIVTQKKKFENNQIKFEELYPPVGGNYGSNNINQFFIDRIIKSLFGEENVHRTKTELYKSGEYYYWVNFENSIERFKLNFISLEQLNKSYEIDCELFSDLKLDIIEKIKTFNNNHEWKLSSSRRNAYKIQFPFKIIYDFMVELVTKVIDLIIPITEQIKDINSIIFSGGASVSPILLKIFDDSYLNSLMNFSRSQNPEVAISLGSILFAMSHNIITPRKAKYTFGIEVSENWDDSKHQIGGKKIYNKLDEVYHCENLFSKFITKGQNLRPDEVIEHSYLMCGSKANIELYRTEKNNVVFCDEKNENGELIVWKFGNFMIDVGKDFDSSSKNMRKVIVKMKMGGTFISAEAIYCKTGKKADMICLFE